MLANAFSAYCEQLDQSVEPALLEEGFFPTEQAASRFVAAGCPLIRWFVEAKPPGAVRKQAVDFPVAAVAVWVIVAEVSVARGNF